MTADSLQKQDQVPGDRLFRKGRSGNPAGRQPGCRNRATIVAEALLEGEAQALTRKAIELALEGDTTALRLCLERVVPQRKSRTVAFDPPRLDRIGDLAFENAIRLHELAPAQASLEEAFMELTADSVEFQAHTPGQQDADRTDRIHPTGVASR